MSVNEARENSKLWFARSLEFSLVIWWIVCENREIVFDFEHGSGARLAAGVSLTGNQDWR